MTETATLVLMCGLSFSGKSTLAQRLATEPPAAVLSIDSINEERGLYGGGGIPGEEWENTLRIADERASGLLGAGHDVVIEDTGSPRFVRDRWRAIANRERSSFKLV